MRYTETVFHLALILRVHGRLLLSRLSPSLIAVDNKLPADNCDLNILSQLHNMKFQHAAVYGVRPAKLLSAFLERERTIGSVQLKPVICALSIDVQRPEGRRS